MGRKTDALLRGFRAAKCLTLLKLTTSRIKVVKNKRSVSASQLRKEVAQLIKSGHEAHVYITKADVLIKEENLIAAYDLIEQFCHSIISRFPIIETQKTIPLDMKEPIASLIYAAPRCTELSELGAIKDMFTGKYGKEFAAAAAELRPDCGVNRLLIEKLTVKPATGQMKLKLMKDICVENKIDWTPQDAFGDQPNNSQEEQKTSTIKFQAGEVKTLSVNDPGPSKANVVNQSQVSSRPKVDSNYNLPVNRPPEAGRVNSQTSKFSTQVPHSEENTYKYQKKASGSQPEKTYIESEQKVSEYGSEAMVDEAADSCSDSYLSVEEEMSEDEKPVSKLETSQSKSRVEQLSGSKNARIVSGKIYDRKSSSKKQALQEHSYTSLQGREDILETGLHEEVEPAKYQMNDKHSQLQLSSTSFGYKDQERSRFEIKDHSSTSLGRREDVTSPKNEVHEEEEEEEEEYGNYEMNDESSEKGQLNTSPFGVRHGEMQTHSESIKMWTSSNASTVSTNSIDDVKASQSVIEDANDMSEIIAEAVQKTNESVPDDFAATAKAIAEEAARLALLEYAKKHGLSSPISVNLDAITNHGLTVDGNMNINVLANVEKKQSASTPVKMHGDGNEHVNVFSIEDESEKQGVDSCDGYVWDINNESEVDYEENSNPFAKESGEPSVEGAGLSSSNREDYAANWNYLKPPQPEDDYLNSIFTRRLNWEVDDGPNFDNWDRYSKTGIHSDDSSKYGKFRHSIHEEVPKKQIFNDIFYNKESKQQELTHVSAAQSSKAPQFDELPEPSSVKMGEQQFDDTLDYESEHSQEASISKVHGTFDVPEKPIFDDVWDNDLELQKDQAVKIIESQKSTRIDDSISTRWDSLRTTKSSNVYDDPQDECIIKQDKIGRSRKDYSYDSAKLQPTVSTRTSSLHSSKTQELHEYADNQYEEDASISEMSRQNNSINTDNTQGKAQFRTEKVDRYSIEISESMAAKADPFRKGFGSQKVEYEIHHGVDSETSHSRKSSKSSHRNEFGNVVETKFDDYEDIFEIKSPVSSSSAHSEDKEEYFSKLVSDRSPLSHRRPVLHQQDNRAESNYLSSVSNLRNKPTDSNRVDYKDKVGAIPEGSGITLPSDIPVPKSRRTRKPSSSTVSMDEDYKHSKSPSKDYAAAKISETSTSNVNWAKPKLNKEVEEPKILSSKQANHYAVANEEISADPSGADGTRRNHARSPVQYQYNSGPVHLYDSSFPSNEWTRKEDQKVQHIESKFQDQSVSSSLRVHREDQKAQHIDAKFQEQSAPSSLRSHKEDQKAQHIESKFQDQSAPSSILIPCKEDQKAQQIESKFQDQSTSSSLSNTAALYQILQDQKPVMKNDRNKTTLSSISDPLILATMAPPSKSSSQKGTNKQAINMSEKIEKISLSDEQSISDPMILATMAPPSKSSSKKEKGSLYPEESISDPMILATMAPPSKSSSKKERTSIYPEKSISDPMVLATMAPPSKSSSKMDKTTLSHEESISDPMLLATMPPPSKKSSKKSSAPLNSKESTSTASVNSTPKDSISTSSKVTSASKLTSETSTPMISARTPSSISKQSSSDQAHPSSTTNNKPMYPDLDTLQSNFEAFRRMRLGLDKGK